MAKAQADGFAESDPRNDTGGWDTACKLLLLANFGLDADLTIKDMLVEGIQSVTDDMITAWRAEGLVPKLVGRYWYEGSTAHASVGVQTFDRADPLAHVTGKNKAIRITTDTWAESSPWAQGLGTHYRRPPSCGRQARPNPIDEQQ